MLPEAGAWRKPRPGRPDRPEDDPAPPLPFVAGRGSKALTVAIAGVLAAPLAAQAVDFTISGHINRALFINDGDRYDATGARREGTRAAVGNNGTSSTRIRATGSGEILDGAGSVGVNLEYEEGGTVKQTWGESTGLSLRHANVWYSGSFGKMTIGQGSEAGDASAYSDKSGVFGVNHGQGGNPGADASGRPLGGYWSSLDAGTRSNNIRYDAPSLGPVTPSISLGGDDAISAKIVLSQDIAGTAVKAQLGAKSSSGAAGSELVGASIGVKLPGGFTWSGAWANQDMTDPAKSDPSYFATMIGYVMGDSAVAAGIYRSADFENEGSEGQAIGVGFIHMIPKAGVELYAAAQAYTAEDDASTRLAAAGGEYDRTVVTIGTRVMF